MLWALVVMSIIIPGCKCFFIVARSISVILYCLIPVWQQCNMERGEILSPKIATDYPNKLLPWLARYTVLSLPWHVLHNKPNYLLHGTSKNVSSFLPCEARALDERKIRARRMAPPGSRSCVPVSSWCHSHDRFPGFYPPPWREELGNEVFTRTQSSACYAMKFVPALIIFLNGGYDYTFSSFRHVY